MRQLPLLALLCITPTALALPQVHIHAIDGYVTEEDPEVPAGIPGLPVDVRRNFDPVGYTPAHDLGSGFVSGGGPLQREQVREIWMWDWEANDWYVEYEFTYVDLPGLLGDTDYDLQISVGMVASEPREFHTP